LSQIQFQDFTPEEKQTFFVDVMLPVPIPKLFTYRVPHDLSDRVAVGHRVVVQFGNKKILTGIIGKIHQAPPQAYEARYILELLDETPMVNTIQLELFQWIANYYVCTIGEVLNIALPSGLKLSSESNIQLHPEFESSDQEQLSSEKEITLLNLMKKRKTLTNSEAIQAT